MHTRLKCFSFCGCSVGYAGKIRVTNGSRRDALIVNDSSTNHRGHKAYMSYVT